MKRSGHTPLTAELLEVGYRQGLFPMAEEDGTILWLEPHRRAVVPLEGLRPSRRTLRLIRSGRFHVTEDHCFEEVMRACAQREETWISEEMIAAYTDLHRSGKARSVEVWEQDDLVGGLYGVELGRAFFGESMFSRVDNASKVAFFHVVDRLRDRGFLMFDVQLINPHTASLGAIEVDRASFLVDLAEALS